MKWEPIETMPLHAACGARDILVYGDVYDNHGKGCGIGVKYLRSFDRGKTFVEYISSKDVAKPEKWCFIELPDDYYGER